MGDVLPFRRPPTTSNDSWSADRPRQPRELPHHPEPAPRRPGFTEPLWRVLAGSELRAARLRRGERLAEVAGRAGISVQYLSEIERGRKEPSSEVLAAVVGALQLTLVDLTSSVGQTLRTSRDRGPGRPSDPVLLAA